MTAPPDRHGLRATTTPLAATSALIDEIDDLKRSVKRRDRYGGSRDDLLRLPSQPLYCKIDGFTAHRFRQPL